MSCIQYAAPVIISNGIGLMCLPPMSGSWRIFHDCVKLFSSELLDTRITLFVYSERIRAITQGDVKPTRLYNVWSCSAQSCSDSCTALFVSSGGIRAITQGELSSRTVLYYEPFYFYCAAEKYITLRGVEVESACSSKQQINI